MDLSLDGTEIVINVKVGNDIESINLRDDLKINDKDLSHEFINQPSLFAWYSALLADQEDKLGRAKTDLSSCKADIIIRLRKGKIKITATNGQIIKVTDSVQDSYVEDHKLYNQYRDEVHRLEGIVRKLKVLKDASIQRKDMLMQLGALKRAEMEQFNMGSVKQK
jgi:hypothetical protein